MQRAKGLDNVAGVSCTAICTAGYVYAVFDSKVLTVFGNYSKNLKLFLFVIGIIGKWHLGLHLSSNSDFHFHPLKQGFHYFYGLPLTNLRTCEPGQYLINLIYPGLKPTNVLIATAIIAVTLYIFYLTGLLNKSVFVFLLTVIMLISFVLTSYLAINSRLNCFVMKNYDVVEQPTILENLTMRFTDEAVNFIRANKDSPFLLYMPFAKVHTALFNTHPFTNHSAHGRYGDNVEEMDWSVGQIMAAVEELGLKENTFVYFTSDNGPHLEEITDTGEYHGGWHGIYKGGKMSQKKIDKRKRCLKKRIALPKKCLAESKSLIFSSWWSDCLNFLARLFGSLISLES